MPITKAVLCSALFALSTLGCSPGAMREPKSIEPFSVPLSPRGSYCSVWTGTELLLWGGEGGQWQDHSFMNEHPGHTYFGDGAAYEPRTKRWRPLASKNAPSPRACGRAVWTGTHMLVWGGDNHLVPDSKESPPPLEPAGALYDPATDSWTAITDAPEGAPMLPDNALWTGKQWLLENSWLYSPETRTWEEIPRKGGPPGHRPLAVWSGREILVLSESIMVDGPNFANAYDPIKRGWRRVKDPPRGNPGPGSAHGWHDGNLFIQATVPMRGLSGLFINASEWALLRFDPSSEEWETITDDDFGYCPVGPGSRWFETARGALWVQSGRGCKVDLEKGAVTERFRLPRAEVAAWTGQELYLWGGLDVFTGSQDVRSFSTGGQGAVVVP